MKAFVPKRNVVMPLSIDLSPVIRRKDETQNGGNKKTKHAKFSEKRPLLTLCYAHIRVRIKGKKWSFFRKFGVLCYLVTSVLRFALFTLSLTLFHPTGLFLCSLKILVALRFSDVFSGYIMTPVAWYGWSRQGQLSTKPLQLTDKNSYSKKNHKAFYILQSIARLVRRQLLQSAIAYVLFSYVVRQHNVL